MDRVHLLVGENKAEMVISQCETFEFWNISEALAKAVIGPGSNWRKKNAMEKKFTI
ncbi:MAG: hypothetical protein JSW35_11940 [Deltaproteobacteria bacterium]|nr:MAG: hypothetical protein JSW35_11940 [Deltaproteobacteria bacterium]